MAPTPTSGSVPCILLTGALGSGKTTIIQDLMQREDMAGTALVVNEFGEVGLDHLLVSSAVETTLLLENGCMCCSLRGDVVDTILGLFADVARGSLPPFQRILIETTGLADPVPIIRDLTSDPALKGKAHLGAVCTVVDGVLGPGVEPAAENQVVQADLIVLTNSDLAVELEFDLIRERTQSLNPFARLFMKSRDGLPATADLETAHVGTQSTLSQHVARHSHHEHHAHGTVSSWSIETGQTLDLDRVRSWLDLVYSLHAAHILRMKGILYLPGQMRGLLVQAVGPVISPPIWIDQPKNGAGPSRLVLIFRDLNSEQLAQSFASHVGVHSPKSLREVS